MQRYRQLLWSECLDTKNTVPDTILSFAFRDRHWGAFDFPGFLNLSFSPGSLIIYIILWLVIPEATSTSEKLEMKGEKVDMNSIKNSVVEEMKGVQQRAEKFG